VVKNGYRTGWPAICTVCQTTKEYQLHPITQAALRHDQLWNRYSELGVEIDQVEEVLETLIRETPFPNSLREE
jgi:hypothetical protein